MRAYSCKRLSNRDVLEELCFKLAQGRSNTVEVLALLAEAESRRLYLPAGYPSMYEYCVHELHMSEHEALLRIRAARAARQFPAIFDAVAEGRLHLTAVVLLKPHLTWRNAADLLAAATHKTKVEISLLLAQRFPQSDLPTRIQAIAPTSLASPAPQHAPTLIAAPFGAGVQTDQLVPERVALGMPNGQPDAEIVAVGKGQQVAATEMTPYPKVTPRSAERFAVQFTMDQDMHDRLQRVRDLLGHQIPSGDIVQVFDRALKLLERELEKNRFAATQRPRISPMQRPTAKRTIQAQVRRAVRERDQDRCTFVSDTGHRCGARRFLEFDHADPVARGGEATVENPEATLPGAQPIRG